MQWLRQLQQKAKRLKKEVEVLVLAYKDKRTPVAAKLLIGITVGYLLSPIDLIPDFIPVLGLLDDLLIVPLFISISLKMIPAAVLAEARAAVQSNDAPLKKQNRLAAICIIVIWLWLIYLAYRYFVQ